MKFLIPAHRRLRITLGGIAIIAVVVCVYASVFCIRNAMVRSRWDAWTSHLVGPPSWWTDPSNDFERFHDESMKVTTDSGWTTGLWGYKDSSGVVVIPPRFTACAEHFYEGVAWAKDPFEKRTGFIHPDGTWKFILDGETAQDFVEGRVEFWVWGPNGSQRYGFLNLDGEVVVPPRYHRVSWYVDGYVLVEERTWIGAWIDRRAHGFYGLPGTPFDAKAIILDKHGNRAKLPTR